MQRSQSPPPPGASLGQHLPSTNRCTWPVLAPPRAVPCGGTQWQHLTTGRRPPETCRGATGSCTRVRAAPGSAWRPRWTAHIWPPQRGPSTRPPCCRSCRARSHSRGRCRSSTAGPASSSSTAGRPSRPCPPPSGLPAARQLGIGRTAAAGGVSAPIGSSSGPARSSRPTTSSSSTSACARAGGKRPSSARRCRRPSRLRRRLSSW
mmetsp:Transcript_56496/g.156394  ORF Transcript_56496/g.156394 Transcript_56496/m.156394 type:complete len:206 (+) Transcript_56496:188-805(+)